MAEQLFDHVDLAPDATVLPRGDAPDPARQAAGYEAAIRRAGGIDLQLLGIGRNGHIGFNEPTSSLASRTRVKTLTRSTREANARYFASFEDTPRFAITMGIGTVLDVRAVVLLALGADKAEAVRDMIEGPLAALCPASALQLHPDVTVILDPDSASALRLRAYYGEIHSDGADAPL
jgi:glucosamine-6-phosphate deaminase